MGSSLVSLSENAINSETTDTANTTSGTTVPNSGPENKLVRETSSESKRVSLVKKEPSLLSQDTEREESSDIKATESRSTPENPLSGRRMPLSMLTTDSLVERSTSHSDHTTTDTSSLLTTKDTIDGDTHQSISEDITDPPDSRSQPPGHQLEPSADHLHEFIII